MPSQWSSGPSSAYDPATNTGLCLHSPAFSISIDWSAETITQTARSISGIGSGTALLWDPTRGVYWAFGASGNSTTLYEINPTTFAVTPHTLTGDAPLAFESGTQGTYGRWVFLDSWRAIGSVASRTSPAFVIRLP